MKKAKFNSNPIGFKIASMGKSKTPNYSPNKSSTPLGLKNFHSKIKDSGNSKKGT